MDVDLESIGYGYCGDDMSRFQTETERYVGDIFHRTALCFEMNNEPNWVCTDLLFD